MLFVDWDGIGQRIKRQYWWLETLHDRIRKQLGVQLGYTGPVFARRDLTLRGNSLFWHKQVMGNTGSGKTELLKQLIRQFIGKGIPFCLIDPHSDLAESVLSYLMQAGFFQQYTNRNTGELSDKVLKKLVYVDFGIKDSENRSSHFIPYNILKQPYTRGDVAQDIVEVMLRLWPYLEQSSPQFQDILKNAVVVLIANDLPIVKLRSVLKNKPYREELLKQVSDPALHEYFHYSFDEWDARFAPQMVESTLNKFSNLLFSDVLRYSLGQTENSLKFDEFLRDGTCVIFNLGGVRREIKKLLGCLITLGMENAMYARYIIPPWKRTDYFFIIDEFKQFINTSEDAVDVFLSEARKFKVWLILAHQYLGQLTPELVAALQNTQRLVLKLEDDAISMAQRIGKYQPDSEIDQIEDEEARKRAHKHTFTARDEYEMLANDIKDLFVGEGFIRYKHKLEKFKAPYVPDSQTATGELQKLKRWYADKLMVPRSTAVPTVNALFTQPQDTQTPHLFHHRSHH